MGERQLLMPSHSDVQHSIVREPFKLQPPPLRKREKRKGKLFARKGSSESSSLNQESFDGESAKPNISKFKTHFNFTSSFFEKHDGDMVLSPKQILANDDRLFFPPPSAFSDDENDDDDDLCSSQQATPKAAHFRFSSLRKRSSFSVTESKQSENAKKLSSKTSSMTNGTFGILRRRSSAQANSQQSCSTVTELHNSIFSHQSKSGTFGKKKDLSNHQVDTIVPDRVSSQKDADIHTVISLPPQTPVSAHRLSALHSPVSIAGYERYPSPKETDLLDVQRDKYPSSWNSFKDHEPLSATLKRIGAARTTGCFAIVDEDDQEEDVTCLDETVTSFVPEHWVSQMNSKFDDYEEAKVLLEKNRAATEAAIEILSHPRLFVTTESNLVMEPIRFSDEINPAETECGYTSDSTLQASPFLKPTLISSRDDIHRKPTSYIQSTPRGAPHRTPSPCLVHDDSESLWKSMRRMSQTLSAFIFGNHVRARSTETDVFFPVPSEQSPRPGIPLALAARSNGDGWGGMRPRTSWFPDLRLGPLLSPTNDPGQNDQRRPIKLRSFHLKAQPSNMTKSNDESEWVDEEDEKECRNAEKSCTDSSADPVLRNLRVRFPSQLPAPNKQRREQEEKEWKSMQSQSTMLTFTNNSVEARPVQPFASRVRQYFNTTAARRSAAVLMLLAIAGAITCVIVLLVDHHHHSHKHMPDDSIPFNETSNVNPSSHRRSMIIGAVLQSME